jgi:hypothetical protein
MRRVAVCLAAALAGCGSRGPARIDPALEALVPSDTVLAAGVRLQALRETPLYRHLTPLAGALKPDRVSELLLVSNGKDTAVLARGDFAGQAEPGIVFVDPRTAVAGSAGVVRAILQGRRRGGGLPAALRGQVELIPREDPIWAAGASTAGLANLAPRTGNLANLGTALDLVDRFHAGADVRNGVKAAAVADCRSAEDAESLAGALRVVTGLMRLNADVETRRALDGVRIEQEGRTVRVDVAFPEETLEKLSGTESPPPRRP